MQPGHAPKKATPRRPVRSAGSERRVRGPRLSFPYNAPCRKAGAFVLVQNVFQQKEVHHV